MRVRKRNQEEKRDKIESRRELSDKIRKIQKSIRKELTGRGLEILKNGTAEIFNMIWKMKS